MQNVPSDKPIPHLPGVYQFKDEKGAIIYIGKAKDLKKRVASYFSGKKQWDKTAALVKNIREIDFIITDSEDEAILVESNLIKQYYPKYNIALKDNSPITYALITNEEYPRLLLVRKNREGKIIGPPGKAYGPFMSGSGRGLVLGPLRKAFKIRTCGSPMPKRVCLQYHLGNCLGPCEEKISREEYMENVKKLQDLLVHPSKIEKYADELEIQMKMAAGGEDFEKAISLRNSWTAISGLAGRMKVDDVRDKDEDYIVFSDEKGHARVQVWRMIHGVIRDRLKFEFDYVEEDVIGEFLKRFYEKYAIPRNVYANKMPIELEIVENHLVRLRGAKIDIKKAPAGGNVAELMQLIEKNILMEKAGGADPALLMLQKELNLPAIPLVIECFDISNLGEKDVVGSMVQFVNAAPRKSEYRKFKVRSVLGQDDFASMKEVVFRRYRRLLDEGGAMPDMILIDGGLGQLHAAQDALSQLGLELPVFSLAKQEEEVYGEDMLEPLRLAKNNEGLHVLQRARDEAHRFAINYNRKLRGKRIWKE